MQDKINNIKNEYSEKISNSSTLSQLDELFLALFGKSGEFTNLSKEFPKLPKEELPKVAPLFSSVKLELEKAIETKRNEIKEVGYKKLDDEELPVILNANEESKDKKFDEARTLNQVQGDTVGHLHPLTIFENEIVEIFSKLGFQRFEAPYIDTDYNNFEALNIPPEHPARDLWDTLYIDSEKYGFKPGSLLLRTHTSNSQTHILEKHKPPFRFMNIGNCFRYENLDARHEHTFNQFEIIYVDKGLSMANLQYLSEQFFQAVFGPDIKVRLRPKYYPFVEPGVGVDAQCIFCKGNGCKICGNGWVELAGAGMIHPTVLKHGGIDSNEYSGIAWGVGPERMLMLRYGINDIRLFRSGDLKFIENYNKKKEGVNESK